MTTIITTDLLRAVMPHAHAQNLQDFCQPLNVACAEYEINTAPARLAAFLAQVAVESDDLWHSRSHYGTERGCE